MFPLLLIQSDTDRRGIVIDAPLVVGRADECDVRVRANGVSRRHALVRPCLDAVLIEDLGSTNGTWVNRQRVAAPRPLTSGDAIRIGDMRLVFRHVETLRSGINARLGDGPITGGMTLACPECGVRLGARCEPVRLIERCPRCRGVLIVPRVIDVQVAQTPAELAEAALVEPDREPAINAAAAQPAVTAQTDVAQLEPAAACHDLPGQPQAIEADAPEQAHVTELAADAPAVVAHRDAARSEAAQTSCDTQNEAVPVAAAARGQAHVQEFAGDEMAHIIETPAAQPCAAERWFPPAAAEHVAVGMTEAAAIAVARQVQWQEASGQQSIDAPAAPVAAQASQCSRREDASVAERAERDSVQPGEQGERVGEHERAAIDAVEDAATAHDRDHAAAPRPVEAPAAERLLEYAGPADQRVDEQDWWHVSVNVEYQHPVGV